MDKKIDLLVISLIVIISAIIGLRFNLKPLIIAIFAWFIPPLYLSIRKKKNWPKILLATFVFGGIFGFVFDFIETINKAWYVGRLVIPWRILGVVPIDDIIGFLFMTFFIVVFYEHFIDDEKNRQLSKNFIWSLIPSALVMLVIILVFITSGSTRFDMSYIYLKGGLAAILLPVIISFWKPKLLGKLLKIGVFFFFLWFLSEIVALKTGGWIFPGQYIGTVSILGVTFPFEEFFFWMMVYASSIVSYYELFVDDIK